MSKRILVVEDDQLVRELLQTTLELEGYSVETVEDGCHALRALAEEVPDVAVVDLAMPRMGGLELLDALDTDVDDPPAVVVLSGSATPEIEQEARNVGANIVLRKPAARDELLGAIEAALMAQEAKP